MSLPCAVFLCLVLFMANKKTILKKEVLELPDHYFLVSCYWIFMSGSWVFWNPVARTFFYRKLYSIWQKISGQQFSKKYDGRTNLQSLSPAEPVELMRPIQTVLPGLIINNNNNNNNNIPVVREIRSSAAHYCGVSFPFSNNILQYTQYAVPFIQYRTI